MDGLPVHHPRGGVRADALHPLLLHVHQEYPPLHADNYYVVNYPVDDTGTSCFLDQTDAPFIFFQNINDLSSNKHCLAVCPNAGDGLQCSAKHPCAGAVSSYATDEVINELGGFCMPRDAALRDKFWANPIIANKEYLISGYSTILLALLVGLCVGIIYLVLFMLVPKMMTFGAFLLSFLSLVTVGILLIVQPINLLDQDGDFWNIFFGVLFIVVGVLFLFFYFCHSD